MKALLVLLVGAFMLSDPRCCCGCRVMAEHLFTHGLNQL